MKTNQIMAIIILMLSHGVCFALGALYAYIDVRREVRRQIEKKKKQAMKPRIRLYYSFSKLYVYGYVVNAGFLRALEMRGTWSSIPCDCFIEGGRIFITAHSQIDRLTLDKG